MLTGDDQRNQGGFTSSDICQGKEVGATVIFRPLSRFQQCFGFTYPAADKEGKDKFSKINLSIPLSDRGVRYSTVEQGLVSVYWNQVHRIKERLAEKGKVNVRVDKIKDRWGADQPSFGLVAEYLGNIQGVRVKPSVYQPGPKSAVKEGIWHLMRKTEGGKLLYMPLISKIALKATGKGSANFGQGDIDYIIWEPTILLDKKFISLLPSEFVGCAYVHPDDYMTVQEWLDRKFKAQAIGDVFAEPVPYYRDYPDSNTGEVKFVATQPGSDGNAPLPFSFNVYTEGAMTESVVEQISQKPYIWEFDPSINSTYYYAGNDGAMVFVTEQFVKDNITAADKDGNAIVKVDGTDKLVKYWEAKWWRERFNPYISDKEGNSLLGDKDADLIATDARTNGVPMKGDKAPESIDWKLWLAQPSRS